MQGEGAHVVGESAINAMFGSHFTGTVYSLHHVGCNGRGNKMVDGSSNFMELTNMIDGTSEATVQLTTFVDDTSAARAVQPKQGQKQHTSRDRAVLQSCDKGT